jgi:hypothetical protein
MPFATRILLSLFVALSVVCCRSDDDSQENYFSVGNDPRHRIVLAARIGDPIQMENTDGTLFYRQQVRFWDEGYTYADSVVTGEGQILTLWLNMTTPELQPNNYIIQGNSKGSWGQMASGTWTVSTPGEESPFQRYPILDGSYMKVLQSGDTYTFTFDLKVALKFPVSFEGYYQGPLERLQE